MIGRAVSRSSACESQRDMAARATLEDRLSRGDKRAVVARIPGAINMLASVSFQSSHSRKPKKNTMFTQHDRTASGPEKTRYSMRSQSPVNRARRSPLLNLESVPGDTETMCKQNAVRA